MLDENSTGQHVQPGPLPRTLLSEGNVCLGSRLATGHVLQKFAAIDLDNVAKANPIFWQNLRHELNQHSTVDDKWKMFNDFILLLILSGGVLCPTLRRRKWLPHRQHLSCCFYKLVFDRCKNLSSTVPHSSCFSGLGDSRTFWNTQHGAPGEYPRQALRERCQKISLPPATSFQLREQAQKIEPGAAAESMAGNSRSASITSRIVCARWRIFSTQNEAGTLAFPILTPVRMVLSKRLICFQSILTLLSTRLRFAQLQAWQQSITPWQLKGGVKNRQMNEVHSKAD